VRYRKKVIEVEAHQFVHNRQPWPDGVCLHGGLPDCLPSPHVHTLEGPLHVSNGDYIITGVKGERYPCKPDIFSLTYELAKAR